MSGTPCSRYCPIPGPPKQREQLEALSLELRPAYQSPACFNWARNSSALFLRHFHVSRHRRNSTSRGSSQAPALSSSSPRSYNSQRAVRRPFRSGTSRRLWGRGNPARCVLGGVVWRRRANSRVLWLPPSSRDWRRHIAAEERGTVRCAPRVWLDPAAPTGEYPLPASLREPGKGRWGWDGWGWGRRDLGGSRRSRLGGRGGT